MEMKFKVFLSAVTFRVDTIESKLTVMVKLLSQQNVNQDQEGHQSGGKGEP
jgi:hypothetical protein